MSDPRETEEKTAVAGGCLLVVVAVRFRAPAC